VAGGPNEARTDGDGAECGRLESTGPITLRYEDEPLPEWVVSGDISAVAPHEVMHQGDSGREPPESCASPQSFSEYAKYFAKQLTWRGFLVMSTLLPLTK